MNEKVCSVCNRRRELYQGWEILQDYMIKHESYFHVKLIFPKQVPICVQCVNFIIREFNGAMNYLEHHSEGIFSQSDSKQLDLPDQSVQSKGADEKSLPPKPGG